MLVLVVEILHGAVIVPMVELMLLIVKKPMRHVSMVHVMLPSAHTQLHHQHVQQVILLPSVVLDHGHGDVIVQMAEPILQAMLVLLIKK